MAKVDHVAAASQHEALEIVYSEGLLVDCATVAAAHSNLAGLRPSGPDGFPGRTWSVARPDEYGLWPGLVGEGPHLKAAVNDLLRKERERLKPTGQPAE